MKSKEIFAFAQKWEHYFSQPDATISGACEFALAAQALAFNERCVVNTAPWNQERILVDSQILAEMIDETSNVYELGDAMMYQWRMIRERMDVEATLCAADRRWMQVACQKLAAITNPTPAHFKGEIISVRCCFDLEQCAKTLLPIDEVSQDLYLRQNGDYEFVGNEITVEGELAPRRIRNGELTNQETQALFKHIQHIFQTYQPRKANWFAGEWKITIETDAHEHVQFQGVMTKWEAQPDIQALAEHLRMLVPVERLIGFDAVIPHRQVQEIKLSYLQKELDLDEITTTDVVECGDEVTKLEMLVIQRRPARLEYTQIEADGAHCKQTIELLATEVEAILDPIDRYYFQPRELEEQIEGEHERVVHAFTCTLSFSDGEMETTQGTFNAETVPYGYAELMQRTATIMQQYVYGQLFDQQLYRRRKKRQSDFIYYEVEVFDLEMPYYYRSEDDTIDVGDEVIVPFGKQNYEWHGTIVSKAYYSAQTVPFPLARTKLIIRKVDK